MIKSMTKKQKKLLNKIILAALLCIPCFFIPESFVLIRTLAFLVPYAVAGYDVLFKAARNIRHGHILDENLLMCIATVGAFCLGEFTEAVMVMLLYQIGELFESCAVARSRKSIAALMDIRPDYANLIDSEGKASVVAPECVSVGDKILIKSGEKIPLDCIIENGVSEIDTSSLTGEAVPMPVEEGDRLISGSVNISGTLRAVVTKTFGESTVSKILELTERSSERKSRSENFITRFARYYTPAVCILALCMAVIPTLLGSDLRDSLKSALTFLVVSCPCALVISVPLSFFCGIGCASKNGILIKGAAFIEALSETDTVIFDKTGTLTSGKPEITRVFPEKHIDKDTLLLIAARAECFSTHPMALALKKAAGNVSEYGVTDSRQIIGKGVFARVDADEVYVGNRALMDEQGISVPQAEICHETALFVAVNGVFAGIIYASDKIKDDAVEEMKRLKLCGIKKTVMLTGDKKDVGDAIGAVLGISQVYCELMPSDKVMIAERIIEEKTSGKKTAYTGDGINDAPVLSRADVGIAMGAMGSDAAIEASDIVIMDDKLSKISTALKISRKTMTIVKQNIVFSIGVKVAVMAISAVGITHSMWLAIFADVGVAVIAILNALRTFNIKV